MTSEGYLVVVTPSEDVKPGRLALDRDSLAKARLVEGTPVELAANGKKLALVVERGSPGAAGINPGDAGKIGIDATSLARMRKIRSREVKRLALRLVEGGEVDPRMLRSALALRPVSRGSTLVLSVGGRSIEVYVVECEPEDGIVSYNTFVEIVY